MTTNKFGFMLPDTIRNIIAVGAGSFIGGIAMHLDIISDVNLKQ